jgi:hypothetical protein
MGSRPLAKTVFLNGVPMLPVVLSAEAARGFARLSPSPLHDRNDPFGVPRLTSIVLGRTLAHEIGHLLLGRDHTPTGLMRSQFRPGDFLVEPDEPFSLTHDQAVRIATAKRCPLMGRLR